MTLFSIILFIHVASALALFIAFGLEWTASSLLRRSTNSEQARSWLRVYRVSPPISGPALAVLIITGGYLAYLAGLMKQGWIPATLIAIAVAVVLGIVFNVPRLKGIRAALPAGSEPLSGALIDRLNDSVLATSVRVRCLIALGIVFLMATQRPFGESMIALACAAIVGLLLSIPAWRRKTSSASATGANLSS